MSGTAELHNLLTAVYTTERCAVNSARLPVFITDELLGEPVDLDYPDVAEHLLLCPTCLSEYRDLSEWHYE